jgi:hypothetical protein
MLEGSTGHYNVGHFMDGVWLVILLFYVAVSCDELM